MIQTFKQMMLKNRLIFELQQKRRVKKILSSHKTPLKLHLGCGKRCLDGYINIDSYLNSQADIIMDIKKLNSFPNNCAEVIESYHVFEHFHLFDAREALGEWFRLLKPGGLVVIELPNLEVCGREIGKHFGPKGQDLAMLGIYSDPALVKEQGIDMMHKWGWTPSTLEAELSSVGFVNIRQCPIAQTWRKGTSWNRDMQVRANKPE